MVLCVVSAVMEPLTHTKAEINKVRERYTKDKKIIQDMNHFKVLMTV